MSSNPSLVQLRFIYEGDKYLLKELVQEMGLKMAAEAILTHTAFQFGLLNAS